MYKQKKEIIRQGDSRDVIAAARKMEALLEAEERDVRLQINVNSEACRLAKEVAGRHERRDKQANGRRVSRREREARKLANIRAFLMRNYGSVAIIAIVCLLDVFKILDFATCMLIMSLVLAYWVMNIVAYFTRNKKKGVKRKRAACV